MRRALLALLVLLALLAACGPKIAIKPIGTRVDALPPPTPPPPPGAEKALPPSLPGGWRLSGGPADYDAEKAAEPLKDEAGRFRGLKSYAAAEYASFGQQVISLEAFTMSSPDAAKIALGTGRPADAKAVTGDDVDEAFRAGQRAECRKGQLIVRVRWFDNDDPNLPDAALDAMRDALAAGVQAGIAMPAASPVPSPSPSLPSSSPTPTPTPSPSPSR
jgi:hypothetical protein